MRKTERLDQILIRLGYASSAQIEQAAERQQSHGGRFGKNLMELGFVTEEQLFDALVEQFRVPTISVNEGSVPPELVARMPPDAYANGIILPVGWNEDQQVLSLAVANPSDEEAIRRVGQAFGARKVRVSIAPESVLVDLAERLGATPERDAVRLVALPELFEPEGDGAAVQSVPVGGDDRRVLMVTKGAARKNFLPPVFKAEGVGLIVVSTTEEARDALEAGPVDKVVVDAAMEGELDQWIRSGAIPDPNVDVTTLTSVSEALLENPIPYTAVSRSLRGAVQTMAQFRCAQRGLAPPYGLMSNDLDVMADRLAMRTIASDGLNIALHTLMPVPEQGRSIDPFDTFSGSLEIVARLRFPWPVARVLEICRGLFVGDVDLAEMADPEGEVEVAAQVLAMIWFRHNLARGLQEEGEDAETALRTSLRELAGRIVTLDVVEAYLDEIADRGGAGLDAADRRVVLVGEERIARAMMPALTRVGCEVLVADEVAGAQSIIEGLGPAAIMMDHAVFGAEVELFGRVLKLDSDALLFILTDSADPSFVLNLLDIGADDVFGPPHDFDLIAARVSRAIRSHSGAVTASAAEPGQFSASFEAFSFIDLAQMLSNGMKTVRVDLTGGVSERAVLFLANGRPVYAACGEALGPAAVYRVISWEERGEFTVSEDAAAPETNIDESTESLLMEGVRLLDESRA